MIFWLKDGAGGGASRNTTSFVTTLRTRFAASCCCNISWGQAEVSKRADAARTDDIIHVGKKWAPDLQNYADKRLVSQQRTPVPESVTRGLPRTKRHRLLYRYGPHVRDIGQFHRSPPGLFRRVALSHRLQPPGNLPRQVRLVRVLIGSSHRSVPYCRRCGQRRTCVCSEAFIACSPIAYAVASRWLSGPAASS